MDVGVAPVAVSVAVAVPLNCVFPTAAASWATMAGIGTLAWKLTRLNCWPTAGAAGDRLPLITTSLNTRFPIGVLLQKSSKAEVSAKAGAVRDCTVTPTIIIEPATSAIAPAMLMRLAKFGKRPMRTPCQRLPPCTAPKVPCLIGSEPCSRYIINIEETLWKFVSRQFVGIGVRSSSKISTVAAQRGVPIC